MNRITSNARRFVLGAALLPGLFCAATRGEAVQVVSPTAPVVWPTTGDQPLAVDVIVTLEQPVAGLTVRATKVTRPDGSLASIAGVAAGAPVGAAGTTPAAAPQPPGDVALRLSFAPLDFAAPGQYVVQCRLTGEIVGADAKRTGMDRLVTLTVVRRAAVVQFLGAAAPILRVVRCWPWGVATAKTTVYVLESSGQAEVARPSVDATPPTLTGDQTIGGTIRVDFPGGSGAIAPGGSAAIDVHFDALAATGSYASTVTVRSPSLAAPVSQVVTVRVTTFFVWALLAVALGVFASAMLSWWSSTGRLRMQRSWRVASLRLRVNEAKQKVANPMRPSFDQLLADLDDLYARIGMDLVGEFDAEFAKLKARFEELMQPPTESAAAARTPDPVVIERRFKGFELATWIVPLFAAIIGGTLQLALDKPVWGTPSDFATAFLWGFGADLTLRGITTFAGTLVRPRTG